MKQEMIRQFTVRITESNRTQLIAVLYDIIDVYFEDAKEAHAKGERDEYKKNVRAADRVIKELTDILDHKYEISGNLYSLYTWCRQQLAMGMVRNDCAGIEAAKKVLTPLGASFRELARNDDSPPMMKNIQKVTYGATYGRTDVTEDLVSAGINRGFLA